MKASRENPIYTTYIVAGGNKYNITPAVTELDFSDPKNEIAQRATIGVMNVKVKDKRLSDLLGVRNRVYIHADDGSRNEEVFRGYIWTFGDRTSLDGRDLTLVCYDNLIYFQESEESVYFSSGKSTDSICSTLCGNWGVKLSYNYESITHSKLALRGGLADIFMDDVLDLVKDRTGKKYVIRSIQDVMHIDGVGANTTVYRFKSAANSVEFRRECTMGGMVTKVVILGKADDNDRRPVEATVSGNTSEYGTLQKLIDRDENTSLADAKKEANSIIKENGEPKWEFELKASDVPWVRKGDKVHVDIEGAMSGYLIVTDVSRAISNMSKTMTLTMEKP